VFFFLEFIQEIPHMRTFLTSFIVVLLLVLVSGVDASATKTADGPQVIKLQRFRKALWKVHVTLKGKEGDFLFDTGGGVTLITEKFSQGIDCKYWGRNTGYNMFGHKGEGPHCDDVPLSADGVQLSPVSIGKIDLTQWFPDEKNLPDGMLSLDAFDGMAITIDQKAATLTIETDRSLKKRVGPMREFPLRVARECSGRCLGAFLGVKTPDGMTWLNLDTGAGGVSLIAKEYAPTFNLDPEKKEQRIDFPLDGGLRIGGPVMVTDMIMDGNLGQPFLANYVVTLDLKNGRIWLG
jgi:hypothetical protein